VYLLILLLLNEMKKEIIFSTQIREDEILLCLNKTYVTTYTDFYEFQRLWFYRSYKAFKDFDKYLILVYFFQKTFNTYNDYFIKKTYEEFYSLTSFEIEKFNIVNVSKDLFITKETARRKILELQKENIIQKENKSIKLNQNGINIQKPEESVKTLARFLSTFSRVLVKNKFLKNELTTEDCEKLIKNNFTQFWKFFLDFQLPYCLQWKQFHGDLEIFIILGMVIYNQNLYLRKNSPNEVDKNYFKNEYASKLIHISDGEGINAMTISDLTGIPRPTILRKLNKLQERGYIIKNKKSLYRLNELYQNIKPIDQIRLNTVKNWSGFLAKFYNFVEN